MQNWQLVADRNTVGVSGGQGNPFILRLHETLRPGGERQADSELDRGFHLAKDLAVVLRLADRR